jgi:Ser/Thr protein kinase RdoA (MazF antagonist)
MGLVAHERLTRQGRLRRKHQLARRALEAYGLADASIGFVRDAGNTMYRVRTATASSAGQADDLFVDGQFLLRVHQPGYQAAEAIELELEWLAAMRREGDLAVPEPVPRLDGGLLTRVSVPGLPVGYHCSLLRWVRGRLNPRGARAQHYRAQGRLMARMHGFASTWRAHSSGAKRRYDWDGLFMNDAEIGLPPGECWNLLPRDWLVAFEDVARRTREVMAAWGEGPDVFGLIHADMGVDHNVLLWRGDVRPIDFDDSGHGYWMYDIVVALEHLQDHPSFRESRDALVGGYAEHRGLPDAHLVEWELLQAAFYVYWGLWAVGMVHLRPEFGVRHREDIERAARYVMAFADGSPITAYGPFVPRARERSVLSCVK